jgi:predicted ATPase
LEESLTYTQKSGARSELGFLCLPAFRESAIKNKRRGAGFISTVHENGNTTIKLHQDGGSWGQPFQVPATASLKTIVCGINTNDYPTILAARREMQSWTLLQLEPSALRQPDAFSADSHLAANGAHMAATLLRLDAKAQVANRLADLLDDVGSVYVERDESRRTYTLHVSGRDEIGHPARSLSDGTLRFLALAILSADPESGRLLCLEEPENGIHPLRIPAILQLLRDMAVDAGQTVSPENPLRQVIINTHSPKVVPALAIDDLLVAGLVRQKGFFRTVFQCVEGSWRASQSTLETVPLGLLLDYL